MSKTDEIHVVPILEGYNPVGSQTTRREGSAIQEINRAMRLVQKGRGEGLQ